MARVDQRALALTAAGRRNHSAHSRTLIACGHRNLSRNHSSRRSEGREYMSAEHRDELARDPLPLHGRTVLVTGVSRRAGIGHATACRLAAYGASVFCYHYSPHDQEQTWGSDDLEAVLDG